MSLTLLLSLALTAGPRLPPITGLDKPKKEQRGTLGDSATTKGKVTIHCRDVGPAMVVEVNDPGLIGARDVWVEKKSGEAMPPCDESDADGTHLGSAEGFGHVAGTRGDFVFVISADAFGDKFGLRVFSLSSGAQVFETEFSSQHPITLTAEGKSLWMRFHQSVVVTCEPFGETAASCWQLIKESARVPEGVDIKPPPCDALFKDKHHLAATSLVALPAEVDLAAPKTVKFRPGASTCAESP